MRWRESSIKAQEYEFLFRRWDRERGRGKILEGFSLRTLASINMILVGNIPRSPLYFYLYSFCIVLYPPHIIATFFHPSSLPIPRERKKRKKKKKRVVIFSSNQKSWPEGETRPYSPRGWSTWTTSRSPGRRRWFRGIGIQYLSLFEDVWLYIDLGTEIELFQRSFVATATGVLITVLCEHDFFFLHFFFLFSPFRALLDSGVFRGIYILKKSDKTHPTRVCRVYYVDRRPNETLFKVLKNAWNLPRRKRFKAHIFIPLAAHNRTTKIDKICKMVFLGEFQPNKGIKRRDRAGRGGVPALLHPWDTEGVWKRHLRKVSHSQRRSSRTERLVAKFENSPSEQETLSEWTNSTKNGLQVSKNRLEWPSLRLNSIKVITKSVTLTIHKSKCYF